ncbi:2TM domain-containing protein [Winogradskyella psychrotolerans]|uniref:2TM domain-containing protein n=1 Tax=Winogradskyella psychrotolerans TaxID=1344585 RepID=UPI001C07BA37|nr:2TM domain-containing protein [Winogradskyella psychrotolerans]MBU2920853.1 2TM domain-containing protein [Winogradskyella psychrotolerans]
MNNQDKERLRKAKAKVRRIKIFYIHLAGYVVGVALLLYNLYIVSGPYTNSIISLNLSILVAWTVFIVIHGLNVFKARGIFNKRWEDRKTEKFLKEKDEQTTFWE